MIRTIALLSASSLASLVIAHTASGPQRVVAMASQPCVECWQVQ
jgi:hypothetical protein